MKLLTIEQAKAYFIERAKAYEISPTQTYMLWALTKNIIVKAYPIIKSDFNMNAFLETTCNGMIQAYNYGRAQW